MKSCHCRILKQNCTDGRVKKMEEEFALFNAWVDRRLGIPLAAYKENQMQRRILTIMENSGQNVEGIPAIDRRR